MTPREALKILDDATANLPLTRKQNFVILEALKVISQLILSSESKNSEKTE